MYDIKWKNDLKMYMNTFNSFILEGNINDLQPIEVGDGFSYYPLDRAIAEMYSKDYCVVFFDFTKQSGKEIPSSQQADGNTEAGSNTIDETWFNSFTFYNNTIFSSTGERIPSPNIELFKEYYYKQYLDGIKEKETKDMQGSRLIDIRRIHDVINDFEEKRKLEKYREAKPFLFILPDVSRYMTDPGRPDDKENAILMILFQTTKIMNTSCKLMMFVDKINDLPPWFESENSNPCIKKLFVNMPDGKIRESFYMQEMIDVMDPVEESELLAKVQKFSAYTENYSLRRLMQLRSFIINEEDNRSNDTPSYKKVENIDKTVLRFDFGQSKDPWVDKELKGRIKNLVENISQEIKGQDASIIRVADALKTVVTGVGSAKKNDRRPRAIFVFAGPTGTGKTELAKQMAENIFQRQDSIIRFDMSEFGSEHSDARLFGAPPGYVGYEAGGELTRAIKQNPFSIVLFDEIEKAASRIWDKFLQILGDGRLTDGKGETVSFTQSIIIFTSNLGITADSVVMDRDKKRAKNNAEIKKLEDEIKICQNEEEKKKLVHDLYDKYLVKACLDGLNWAVRNDFLFTQCYKELDAYDVDDAFNAYVTNCVRTRIKLYFDNIGRREIFGRIGEENILVFNYMSPSTAESIAKGIIDKFIKYLKNEHYSQLDLEISQEAEDFILHEAQLPETLDLGGRGIVACVEKLLNVPVGEFLFENDGVKQSAIMNLRYGKLVIDLR